MSKNLLIGALSIISAVIIAGCGGGSSPTNTNSDITEANDDNIEGTFIDSVVSNLEYQSQSGISGKTQDGKFNYINGDKVKFHLGKLILGEATPKKDIETTPQDLTENNETLVLILQLLQSLDQNNNLEDGITIADEVIEALSTLDSDINISDLNETALLAINDTLKEHIDKDHDDKIDINRSEAINHFHSTLDIIKHENGECNNSNQDRSGAVIDVNCYETYELTQEIKDAIAYMGNEERLAYDVYKNLYELHAANGDEIRQLLNIADNSEVRHIQTVRDIVNKYDINASELTRLDDEPVGDGETPIDSIRGQYDIESIQELYNALMQKGEISKQDALEVGCMVEVTDVNDLNEYIQMAQEANIKDVEDAFTALREGSYNHYWGFDRGLKNLGIENGCCSLGEIDGVNYCHEEYPQNDNGNGDGNGNGGGNGNGHGHN